MAMLRRKDKEVYRELRKLIALRAYRMNLMGWDDQDIHDAALSHAKIQFYVID